MRRRPPISQEELELFRAEVANVRPLNYDKIPHTPPSRPRVPASARGRQANEPLTAHFSEQFEAFDVRGGEEFSYTRNGVQERVMRRLRRGQYTIDAILDLHGMTVAEARVELLGFLGECLEQGVVCALIIHGKGYSSADRQPVLKGMVGSWLQAYPETLAFHSALPMHGGTGAVYLLLRRGEKT